MTNTWVRRSLHAGVLTAGALLVGGGAAQADPVLTSSGNVGALNGTQALVPVQLPVDICGNAAAVGGGPAAAECDGGATALNPEWRFDHFRSGPRLTSTGNTGVANGTQAYAPVQAPVNVCGNAVGVLAGAVAGCEGGADAEHGPDPWPHTYGTSKVGHGKSDHGTSSHDKSGPGKISYHKDYPKAGTDHPKGSGASATGAAAQSGPTMTSAGNVGLLNGTQALVPVQVPINICGNAIAVLGAAQAGCEGGATAS